MKIRTYEMFLWYFLLMCSFIAHAQNKTIDSIKKILQTQIERTNNKNTTKDTVKIKTLFDLACLYFIDNRYDEGLKVINQARELSEKIKFERGEGLYLGSMVIFHSYSNMQAVFKHLTNQYNSNWNIEDFIGIKSSNTEPDFQLVKNQLFKALNSFDTITNKEALANIHAAIFYRFLDEQKLDSALSHSKIAERYYDDLNKREEAFQIILDKIGAYAGINNKEGLKNEEFYSIDYLTNTTDKRTRAYLYEQMGFNYDRIGRHSSLIQCFLKANEIWEELGDKKGQINACHQLGVYSGGGKREEKAVNYFLKELSIRKEIKDSFEINETYSSLTYACIALGKLEDAENYVLLAKNSIEHNADPFQQARLLDAEGQLLKARKMYPEAISKFKQSAELFRKIGLTVHLSYQYYHLAKSYQALGNLSESLHNANKAFELAVQESWTGIKISASLLISELYTQLHNIPKAYEYLKLYNTIKDEWDSKDETSRTADFETQSLLNQHQRKIDLLEKNNILAEARSSQESLRKNFAFAGIGVILLAGGYSFYRFREKKKLQSQQALMNERLRISRELHDEVGATLSSISIFSQAAIQKSESGNIADSKNILERIGKTSREVMGELNDTVWLINPGNDNLQKIIQRISNYALPLCTTNNIHFEIKAAASVENLDLTVDKRKAIYLIIKEAVNNSLKYAAAKNLNIQFEKNHKVLHISIKDDGRGFAENNSSASNGLNNMKQRAKDVNGKIDFDSVQQKGTEIILQVPLTNIGD